MSLLKGKQIATGSDGVNTANIVDGALAASASGRAKMASSFFDNTTTVGAKFASASIGLDRLEESVIQADGGQAYTADQPMGSNKLTGLADGTASGDAVNKGQLDAVAAGLSWKDAVKVATDNVLTDAYTYDNGTAGVGATLTKDTAGALPTADFDGVTLIAGDRVLVKDETGGNAPYNGIYTITELGDGLTAWILTRETDNDEAGEFSGAAAFVQQGATHADQGWTQTADSVTVGTTNIVWTQFTGTGGITFGTPGAIEPDDAAAAGSSSDAARADHTHSIVGAAPAATQMGAAAGEGSATSFSRSDHVHKANTAADIIQPDDTAAIGTSQDMARADHTHGIVAAVAVAIGASNAEGSSTSFSRADHVHARDTANQEQVTSEAITGTDTAITDTLAATPLGTANFSLYLNGQLQQEGAGNDYTRAGTTITWLASSGTAVDLEASDELLAIYDS